MAQIPLIVEIFNNVILMDDAGDVNNQGAAAGNG